MKLTRCAQGHFYDMEKYSTCPHCSSGCHASNAGRSVMPCGNTRAKGQVAGSDSNDDLPPMSENTSVLEAAPMEEDGDHTIGFFDTDFFGTLSQTTVPKLCAASPVKKVKKTTKDTTPCAGWLVAIKGPYIGTDFRLKVGKNYVGRSEAMDICLAEDRSVSRKSQAVVVYEPKSHLYLAQSGEANSLLYLNNEVVLSTIKLKPYDVLTLGDTNLLLIPLCSGQFNWNIVLDELNSAKGNSE